MSNIGHGRLVRVCDLCGGVDDHPRHVIAGAADGTFTRPSVDVIARVLQLAAEGDRARLVGDLMDTTSTDRHMDCCREAGCPDLSCDFITAGVEDLRGGGLLQHLTRDQEA